MLFPLFRLFENVNRISMIRLAHPHCRLTLGCTIPLTTFYSSNFLPTIYYANPQLQFGIHHETLLTIGLILAFNKTGFLSTSRNRDAPRVKEDLDSVLPVAR